MTDELQPNQSAPAPIFPAPPSPLNPSAYPVGPGSAQAPTAAPIGYPGQTPTSVAANEAAQGRGATFPDQSPPTAALTERTAKERADAKAQWDKDHPPIFSTAARPMGGKFTRANGKTVVATDQAPWVYTLITIDGTVAGAIMADAGAHFLEIGPYTFRTSHVTTPRNGSVPVIFLPSGMAAEIRDPKVIPPDVFGGMTNLAGIAALNAWAAYHDPVPFRGPDGKEVKAVVAKDAKVVVAEPDAPISRDAVAA